MLAMFIKACDLYYNNSSATIPRESYKRKKEKQAVCPVSQHDVPRGEMFYLSFGT